MWQMIEKAAGQRDMVGCHWAYGSFRKLHLVF